jgi:hypothetical protein
LKKKAQLPVLYETSFRPPDVGAGLRARPAAEGSARRPTLNLKSFFVDQTEHARPLAVLVLIIFSIPFGQTTLAKFKDDCKKLLPQYLAPDKLPPCCEMLYLNETPTSAIVVGGSGL